MWICRQELNKHLRDAQIERKEIIHFVKGNETKKITDQVLLEKLEMSDLYNKVVEEPTVLRDITNNRVPDDEGKGKCWNHRRKSEIARERWKILAKALLKPRKVSSKSVKSKNISVRRFTNFGLIAPNKLDSLDRQRGCWLKYTAKNFTEVYMIEIHHLEQNLTAKDLIGFNNTGNICIWPSEEVLTYYLLSNIYWFKGKEILEVGGGMTCMAGVMLAKYGKANRVDLTDGNFISVENVKKIIRKNQLDKNKVASFELNWKDHQLLIKKYDAVLSSDCLFFDETRSDLVETIWQSLRDDGVAFVMAPKRGKTLDSFVKIATERGFYCFIQNYYEESVWKQHLKFKEFCPDYEENLHYPILLLLTKFKCKSGYFDSLNSLSFFCF